MDTKDHPFPNMIYEGITISNTEFFDTLASASKDHRKDLALVILRWRNAYRFAKSMLQLSDKQAGDKAHAILDMENCISELESEVEHMPWTKAVYDGAIAHQKYMDGIVSTLFSTISAASDQSNALYESMNRAEADAANLKRKLARLEEHALSNPETRERVWAMTGGKCFYCEVDLVRCHAELTETCDKSNVFHIDHIVAREKGGPDHIDNYVPSCAGCNIAKGDRSFAEFVRKPRIRLVAGGAA